MAFGNISLLPLIYFTLLSLTLIFPPSHAQDLKEDYVNAHNAARQKVGVSPVTWDDNVAAYAQQYANQRIGDCSGIHSNGKYGENIAWYVDDLSGVDAVKLWVDEKVYYDYGSNTCAQGKVCGHYKQVVWRSSVRIGCAKVRCSGGGTFITCNYDPPGNVPGEKPY